MASDEETADALLHPPWKRALELFKEAKFTYGDFLPHDWFYTAFGLPVPLPVMTSAQADRLKLQWLTNFKPFRDALLEQRMMDLINVYGDGYEIAHPRDQSKRAYQDAMHETRKALRNAAQRIAHVNVSLLSAAERREQADLAAKTAQMALMLRGSRRLRLTDLEAEDEDGE